jgi:hypothetical protein
LEANNVPTNLAARIQKRELGLDAVADGWLIPELLEMRG